MAKFNLKTRRQIRSNQLHIRAEVQTIDEEKRTVDVVWTTGHRGKRRKWSFMGAETYFEELAVDDTSIRMDRLNNGAPVLNMHSQWSMRDVVGVVDRAWVENGVGYATLRFATDEDSDRIWQKVRDKIIRNISVGYIVHKYEDVTRDDDEHKVLRAVDWEPAEISVVPIGFDPNARTRSEDSPESYEVEIISKRSELDDASDDDHQRSDEGMKTKKAGNQAPQSTENRSAETSVDNTPAVDLEAERKAAQTEERERVSGIMTACRKARLGEEFAEKLISEGVSLNDAQSRIIDAWGEKTDNDTNDTRSQQIEAGDHDEVSVMRSGVENALLHRGCPELKSELTEQGRIFRSYSLMEIARRYLDLQGVRTGGMSKMEVAARALHTTGDFANLLANVANKSMRQAYENSPQTFDPFVRRVEVPDFKQVSRVQLGGAPSLQEVKESGEFTYGTIGDSKETYTLSTYGRIISITRQVLINDDLDAFTRIPMLFGRAAADKESDLVYAVLTDNAAMSDGTTLFHADHNNLGTAGDISETTIGEAREVLRLQTGPEGRLLNLLPMHLVVPANLETTARKYFATEVFADSAGNINPYKGMYDPIVEPRLDSNSVHEWYMFADPAQIDTIELAYLQGERGIYTETKEGFNIDGVEIKARLDVAAAAMDHRGMFKNPDAS